VERLTGDLTDVERHLDELAALRVQLRESEQRLARMPALEREAELANEDRRQLDTLRTRVDVLEADLAHVAAELEEAEAGLTAARGELSAATEHASRVIDGMKSSLSWRITAPLRAIKRRR
jgi:DNA repair exonuclease SbcCD ATPase subunit